MFITFQAAEHLLSVAITDSDDDIRRAAILQYRKHPHGVDFVPFLNKDGRLDNKKLSLEKFSCFRLLYYINLFFTNFYRLLPNATNHIHGRIKRSLSSVIARIWQGFHFNLASPSVDWRKAVGGSAVGASFGLVIKNMLDILISKSKCV